MEYWSILVGGLILVGGIYLLVDVLRPRRGGAAGLDENAGISAAGTVSRERPQAQVPPSTELKNDDLRGVSLRSKVASCFDRHPIAVTVGLLAAALTFWQAGKPWSLEDCLIEAAKMPTSQGVRLATDACRNKFR